MSETTICKFPFTTRAESLVSMPLGAKILSVGVQQGMLCLWAKVHSKPVVGTTRLIYVRGTGQVLGKAAGAKYVGTVQIHDEQRVFHVFDGGEV